MLYKVVNQFGPKAGETWQDYSSWFEAYHLVEFCSLDSMMNDSVFTPETIEDWENIVQKDFMIEMITNLSYARKIHERHPGAVIFGLIIEPDVEDLKENDGLLGFDVIDGYCGNSLITNCGGYPEIFNDEDISKYGLLDDYYNACRIRDELRRQFPECAHARECCVWAIYRVSHVS